MSELLDSVTQGYCQARVSRFLSAFCHPPCGFILRPEQTHIFYTDSRSEGEGRASLASCPAGNFPKVSAALNPCTDPKHSEPSRAEPASAEKLCYWYTMGLC